MGSAKSTLTAILITAFFLVRSLCQDSSSSPTPTPSVSSSLDIQATTTPLTSATTYVVTSVITPSNSAASTSTIIDSNATQPAENSSNGGNQGLTAGEIAAIVVCLVVAVLGGLALGFWLARCRRKNKPTTTQEDAEKAPDPEKDFMPIIELRNNVKPPQEADGNALLEMDAPRPELEGREKVKEDAPPAELEGTEPDHIKSSPAELEGDHSNRKSASLKN